VTFGRIGRRGQARQRAFEDEVDLSRFVRRALLRRRSATRRIGVSYEAGEASTSVLPILAQLGLASRVPSVPEVLPIVGVEHAGAVAIAAVAIG
jgi:hypothetical protein